MTNNFIKFKKIIEKLINSLITISFIIIVLAFISAVKLPESKKSESNIVEARVFDMNSSLHKSMPIVIVNKIITFCDEKITKDKLDFFLDFLSCTESQNGIFRPKSKILIKNSWTAAAPNSSARGKWQLLKSTRESIADYLHEETPSLKEFLKDSLLQKKYIIVYLEMCNNEFKKVNVHDKKGNCIHEKDKNGKDIEDSYLYYNAYDKYVGQVINGYYITKSGMLAMAQATGVAGTIKWLEKGCLPKYLPKGTPIADRRLTCQIF